MWGKGKKGGNYEQGKKGGNYEQEDRSRDWYCPQCSERNFLKRAECFKCKSPKPKDGGAVAPLVPATGSTLDGMIKSYNRKGFGFIMCIGGSAQCQDIYYSRESLHPALQTRDIPGEHVTFEIQRFPDGKLVAKNVRPRGDASGFKSDDPRPVPKFPILGGKGSMKGGREEEDRSRDWTCEICKERNFVKRFECFKCKAPRANTEPEPASVGPRRTFSPHAGSRAVRDALAGARGAQRSESEDSSGSRSRSIGKKKKNKKKKRRKDSSSSSSSRSKKKKRKKHKRKRHDSSSDADSSKSSSSSKASRKSSKSEEADQAKSSATPGAQDAAAAPKNPEVEKAKAEALERLLKLRTVEPKEARMKEWRDLLRQWHPDKNPDNAEVATAVFQFLQKAKPMVDTN